MDHHCLPLGHLEAVGEGLAGVHPPLHLRRVRVPPRAVVLRGPALGLGPCAVRLQLLLRAEAGVGRARVHQLPGVPLVDLPALALPVGPHLPGLVGPLVPVQLEPAQVRQHALLARARGARLVRVLDAQHELAPLVARCQVVEERGARAAHVQRARGRGREPHAHVRARRLQHRRRVLVASGGSRHLENRGHGEPALETKLRQSLLVRKQPAPPCKHVHVL
mmetsp:Transcript_20287/g.35663  ORF Transcript_20287/g.35663 Transcript_20287/m.35663 type:complete len:221 (+) Transcript_20287:2430-3092(+)